MAKHHRVLTGRGIVFLLERAVETPRVLKRVVIRIIEIGAAAEGEVDLFVRHKANILFCPETRVTQITRPLKKCRVWQVERTVVVGIREPCGRLCKNVLSDRRA